MDWTIESVKRELPDVTVRINNSKKTVSAKISGRKNPDCTVTVFNTGTLHRGNSAYRDWHYSWQAVVDSLNSGNPLVLDT